MVLQVRGGGRASGIPARRLPLLLVLLAGLGACAAPGSSPTPQFEAARFEAASATRPLFGSRTNRVSVKSVAGGVHVDDTGVFVDPRAMLDPSTGELLLTLEVENLAHYDAVAGAPNSLGTPQRIGFLINGSRSVALDLQAPDADWSDSRVAGSPLVSEGGVARLSPEQLSEIVLADSLAVTIAGSKRSVIYAPEEVAPTFQQHLRRFYAEQVQPALARAGSMSRGR